MKVALIQAPVWWTLDPPLGLAQLAGCAGAAGHEALVCDLNMRLWAERPKAYESLWIWEQFHHWNDPGFVERLFAEQASVVERELARILDSHCGVAAFSVNAGAQNATLRFARLLKERRAEMKVVLGGQYFFFGDKVAETLADPAVDAVIIGAADESFPMLLESYEKTGRIAAAPGVWAKVDGRIVSGGEPVQVKDLDAVPFPDFTGFPLDLYTDKVRLPIAASRGCVWQCRFCSAHSFWKGYTYKSGERIFAEVMHQKKLFPERCHFEFHDITANGDVKALHRFAVLMGDAMEADPKNFVGWKINAILRPEMTKEVLLALKRANCHDIIYGVESGSAKVLKLMNKPYTPETAERVLKDTHDAGIVTVVNVMFGFPGETEEDFQMTLDFLRRNRSSLDRVYGSATFTSLEDRAYLKDHQKQFGIKEVAPERFHNLYWETEDGTNTYPVRMERYYRFRKLCQEVGLEAYKGINGGLDQDRLSNLADYYHHVGKPLTAIRHQLEYLELDLYHEPTLRRLRAQRPALSAMLTARRWLEKGHAGRAQTALKTVDHEASRIEDGRLMWSNEEMPRVKELRELKRRADVALALVAGELVRGEDKKPEPVCAR
jgi:radical SAM superfamily enzyme YgiQ (UPF0313 family)